MVSQSRLIRRTDCIALVHREELAVGELLGKGAFSEVHSVQYQGRRFAMKHLKHKLMAQPDNFRLAASELAVEAHLLASLSHPNILQIHGWAANGVASFTSGNHDSFFLLLDYLEETLDARITRWQKQESMRAAHSQPSIASMADWWRRMNNADLDAQHHQLEQQERQLQHLEKLGICTEIASALAYLHDHGVIFRDLKPNNIGFLNGRVKLFDFGLSRELPLMDCHTPFEMSGKVGTLRYMATEVASHRPYNVSADVYSWAMVAYETLTLTKPFAGWTRDMHASLVCARGVRPEVQTVPLQLRPLLEASWHPIPLHRPTMSVVAQKLRYLEEENLLSLQSPQTVIELPVDFMLQQQQHKQAPTRNLSEFTRSTVMSMESQYYD